MHELGHFSVAKFFGVRVETFSLGFGRKILRFKRGDTTYALSLIPLGGYVKMYGDDPTKEVPQEERKYSFLHKPVGQKIAIVLAGPLMNLFFAVLIFFILIFKGVEVPAPRVGDVPTDSVAFQMGFRSGDKIKKIGNKSIASWDDAKKIIEQSAELPLSFEVQREDTNESASFTATPTWGETDDVLSLKKRVGTIAGLDTLSSASLVGLVSKDSPAGIAGFHSLDIIQEINGVKIEFFREIAPALTKASASTEFEVKVKGLPSDKLADKQPKVRTLTIKNWTLPSSTDASAILRSFGIESTELYLMAIKEKSPAELAGLKMGDRVVSLNGSAVTKWEDILQAVKSYKKESNPIAFVVSREGEKLELNIKPEMTQLMNRKLQEEERFTIGIVPAIASTVGEPVIQRTRNPITALIYGIERSIVLTKLTVVGIIKLVTNEVSPRNVAGVITIGRIANQSFEIGFNAFLKIMAVISINLFLLNLLPIPILDGGHLVFFSIEALRGAPLSLRKMEIAQTIGFVLMMSLMAFALFNDIRNIFHSPW